MFWVIKGIILLSFELCLETLAGYIFFFLASKTLRAITGLFFSNFGYFIAPQLYLSIRVSIFDIISYYFFQFLYDLMPVLQRIDSSHHYFHSLHLLLLFTFYLSGGIDI